MRVNSILLSLLAAGAATATAAASCKSSPSDAIWPSLSEWTALNASIQGTLLRTTPAASSCYAGNPFASTTNCTDVTDHWSYAAYHAVWPESIDYSIFSNHSCLPPGVDGYVAERGCTVGASPAYIVNATTEAQIATAMRWASGRNIRIVVKGTGHDMNGRSTGAYSLSIWTHNLNHFRYEPEWPIPGTENRTAAPVAILGSGNNWGSAYTAVHSVNRIIVGGEDATVGLGGLILNGGHGLLSSTYGLASDNVYQMTVITTDGRRLIANDAENQDLFWALRGAGGAQFGVVTEFVLKTHLWPENVVTAGLSFSAGTNTTEAGEASWDALVKVASLIPDIMDAGVTGTVMAFPGLLAPNYLGSTAIAYPGAAATINLIAPNGTIADMNSTLTTLAAAITNGQAHGTVTVTLQAPKSQPYWSYIKPNPLNSQSSGASSLISSRLLGRRELSDIDPADLHRYLSKILAGPEGLGTMALFGLQGGRGTAQAPPIRRGSAHPAWRSAYVHFMTYGAPINASADASEALDTGVQWYEENVEPVWRAWAGPGGGSYANEGNVFSSTWKEDFYGENYGRLLDVKQRYDPGDSFFSWGGVGSDEWEYDLHSGLLCRRG
ncbi:hypothetical protein BJY01DRAFT_256309 [Aspergillus pseudoustus]|uniref:FAD-binding PCMH-type domain-containing protein n=1 Tax=Aspergillus pseudoustus TaxID=1810923 RepID=A0ABR4IC05_9EURO